MFRYVRRLSWSSEGGTLLAMPKTICAPDTSSLQPGSGATKGVPDEGVLGRPDYGTWAGLMGCEDTKTEDCTHVRMGLSLAWKASMATEYVDSFPLYPTLCNPRSSRCLYKLEDLVRRIHITIAIQARPLGFSHYDLEVDQLL